ncbi:pleckstrin homology domain-containing family A member 6 isoform X13 [Phyllopteryx taeniolatus]|uniref:pleckstrin homology domain-containing family A member 6 isoform X13 n=1 Tax=Phyllopteryx taeniolatus TaxID=161469 RepID=UPI002AD5B4B4|nr:pleckstrin homology domain-containing family A member 6 isoform X13 [Phyllopteryx taeniolatus]
MLKFRVDRRVSQHDTSRPAGAVMNTIQLQGTAPIHTNLQGCDLMMKGKVNTAAEKNSHTKSTNMVSDQFQDVQPCARTSRTPRKAATFGKRSNSMRRNPKAEVSKAGWLYKQASSGVKQWNKRWFVLSDRCLFYYKDEKEDAVLGSLPLLSFRIGGVQPLDNVTRKFAFKVWLEEAEEQQENGELKAPVVFCVQAEHAGTRTYYFSTDSYEEQKEWITAMSEAAEVNVHPSQRSTRAVTADQAMVTRDTDLQIELKQQTEPNENDITVDTLETPPLSTPCSDHGTVHKNGRHRDGGGKTEDEGGGPGCGNAQTNQNPNGWSNHFPPGSKPQNYNSKPAQSQSHSTCTPQRQPERVVNPPKDLREQHHNVVLRRGFVPRTAPERAAQRKSSMAQLQHWVNQRRVMVSQEDINSPCHYYPASQGLNYYGYASGPHYLEEYPLYPPGVRPDSICSVSAVGGYDNRWAIEEKRRSLRDGPHQLYGPPTPRDSWGPQYYSGVEKSMRRLSIQPRSRSVPRSPSLSSRGAYSPVSNNFASPAQSPSAHFDRFSGRMRDDVIYADPSVYNLRRSLSSPKYDYSGDRRSINQGLYHHNYPVSPSIHNKMDDILDLQLQRNLDYLDQQVLEGSRLIGMVTRRAERSSSAAKLCIQVPPFHDVYRELHPTLKLNEIETSKLLGRLCEQNHIVKDHEAVVHRLRMDKDSLEEALVATHQEMEKYHNQPVAVEKLHIKKETLQNQLINIRGELSQASNALTTTRMEFEALEDEAHAIHGDLWEQLNGGLQIKFGEQNNIGAPQDQGPERQSTMNKVGIVPPRTKSPADDSPSWSARVSHHNGRMPNGIARERPKSAVFPSELRSKMSVEEQNERIRRNQSTSVRDKRRSLNLSGGQSPASYRVIRRRQTAHEIDIKDLEAAVRGQGLESPREEIARLRRLQIEPEHYDLDINKELMAPDKVVIPERYLDMEDNTPLSPEEQKEKQKKLERIKTLIAKSNLQNVVPVLDGPVEGGASVNSQQQLQEQQKRIEISCALAAEASRRSRLLSAQCAPEPPTSPTSLHPPPSSADFPTSSL